MVSFLKDVVRKMDKMRIKWKIFLFLIGFCTILLILLWLLEVVFLDRFYSNIKIQSIKSVEKTSEKYIENEDIETVMYKVAENNEVCVMVISESGELICDCDVLKDCVIHKMNPMDLYQLFAKTSNEKNSELMETYKKEEIFDLNRNLINLVPVKKTSDGDTIILSKIVTGSNGEKYMILLNSVITPVAATVQTLRIQLITVSVIMILLSVLLALLIARWVANPIVKINKSAGELGRGNYEVKFEGHGYSEILELRDTLNYVSQELSKVDGLRRELIANVSHDLRTPLTLIEGYSEVMRDIPGENTPENVQVIIDETKRLASLVNDLLDTSKLQSGTQTLNISEFNLTESIRGIINRFSKLCEQKGYTITLIANGDIYVKADQLRISQVLYNLLNNAINYTGEDKRVFVRQSISEGRVKVEVADTGDGIEPDKLPYVWDRYYKEGGNHKRAVTGTGLGLSIVRSILNLHKDAKFGVISKVSKGSVFWFSLDYIINNIEDE